MNCLRPFAFYQALDQTALAEALRVARFRVVVKERPFAGLFRQLHCPRLEGGALQLCGLRSLEKPAAGKHGFEV